MEREADMDPTANASSSEEMRREVSGGSAIEPNSKKKSHAQKVVNSLHGVVIPKVSRYVRTCRLRHIGRTI